MGGLTLGAIGAALIAAVVSLIGLVLGKEQKTSEFRQEWINNLRTEISEYVTNVTAISDQVKIVFCDDNEKLKHLIPYYSSVNSAANSIKLRLNPNESAAKEILDVMARIERQSADDNALSSSSMRELEDELIGKAQLLLKSEWSRVKAGEFAFRLAKYSAVTFVFILLGVLSFSALERSQVRARHGTQPPTAITSRTPGLPPVPTDPAPRLSPATRESPTPGKTGTAQ